MNRNNTIEQQVHSTHMPPSNAPIYYQPALNFYPNPYPQNYQTPVQHGTPPHGYSMAPATMPSHYYAPNSSTIYSAAPTTIAPLPLQSPEAAAVSSYQPHPG